MPEKDANKKQYEPFFHPDFFADIKRLDMREKEEIFKEVEKIKENPEAFKHLHGKGNCYTLRAGNFRIVYSLDGKKIFFLVAARRKEVYEIYSKRLYNIHRKLE